MYKSENFMFRDLTNEEIKQFIEHAMHNPPAEIDMWELYHPICRMVWELQGFSPLKKEN